MKNQFEIKKKYFGVFITYLYHFDETAGCLEILLHCSIMVGIYFDTRSQIVYDGSMLDRQIRYVCSEEDVGGRLMFVIQTSSL